MQVETYEVEEINASEASTMAADAEALELIEKLGLDGQRKYAYTETCTRFPYRFMSPAEYRVYATVFPQQDRLEKFNGSIIPLRVLQVAAFCKANPTDDLKHLEVWHTGIAKQDPILVGRTQDYGGSFYLLARWGDALPTFEELKEKARKIWIAKAKAKLHSMSNEIAQDLNAIETHAETLFETGHCTDANRRYDLESL